MKQLLLLILLTLPLRAQAGEELFTVLVEHYEDSSRPRFEAQGFQGRHWDLKALLTSFEPRLQWVKAVSRRPAAYQGSGYCLRILQTTDGKEAGPFVTNAYRIRVLKNLLSQLRNRQSEMRQASALYRITYPSACGKDSELKR